MRATGQIMARAGVSRRRGFTLVELMVVITIILMVSAVALTTIVPAYNNAQFNGAARILVGALAGARDTAMSTGTPTGIRLLPDPTFNGIDPATGGAGILTTGRLDPARILASNRFIPIQLAPDYSEGRVNVIDPNKPLSFNPLLTAYNNAGVNPINDFPYPPLKTPQGQTNFYLAATNRMLYLVESIYDTSTTTPRLHSPTSWYWNIRIGDKVRIENAGIYYTVVGPMTIPNPEMFVNVGQPGTSVLRYNLPVTNTPYHPEILFLVNGLDDDNDGYVDNGFDGIDNDGDGVADQVVNANFSNLSEWTETEHWEGSVFTRVSSGSASNLHYTITRRPVVSPQARETALPSNAVIDLTTAFTTQERSRLPVDPVSGSVDIMMYPNGTVVPTTSYSSPTSFGMSSSFYHFWLTERTDLYDPVQQTNVPYLLPMVPGGPTSSHYPNVNDALGITRALKGERLLVTLFTRSGQILTNQLEQNSFDGSGTTTAATALNGGINRPYMLPQQGVRGDTR